MLIVVLSMLVSICANKEYIIIPLVKNKCGDLSDTSNYRPIAVSCIVSKILENVILQRIEEYLWTTDNQFGFKSSSFH